MPDWASPTTSASCGVSGTDRAGAEIRCALCNKGSSRSGSAAWRLLLGQSSGATQPARRTTEVATRVWTRDRTGFFITNLSGLTIGFPGAPCAGFSHRQIFPTRYVYVVFRTRQFFFIFLGTDEQHRGDWIVAPKSERKFNLAGDRLGVLFPWPSCEISGSNHVPQERHYRSVKQLSPDHCRNRTAVIAA